MLSFASLSIRPLFLTLLEKHIVNLYASALRPALRALLLCLLPGLEEENSEDFDRAFRIVDRIRDIGNSSPTKAVDNSQGFGDEYFWQCLFLSAVSGTSRRQGTLAFLVRRLPKLGSDKLPTITTDSDGVDDHHSKTDNKFRLPQSAEAVLSPEPGLLIRCFAAGLEDEQPLIQRGFLDLLLSHLPLHSPVLTDRVDDQDLERLVFAACVVLARRDMSLNRRLWSWFLGPDVADEDSETLSPTTPVLLDRKNNKQAAYFKRFALKPLSSSILKVTQQTRPSHFELVRSFRIALSLLDRWEIGNALVGSVFVPLFQCLMSIQDQASQGDYQEALRSASGFFDGIEAGLIWTQVVALVSRAFIGNSTTLDARAHQLELATFLVRSLNIRDEEMMAFHIPFCCVYVLAHIVAAESPKVAEDVDRSMVELGVSFASQLVEHMPERNQLNASFGKDHEAVAGYGNDEAAKHLIASIEGFYAQTGGDISSAPPPFSSRQIATILLEHSNNVFINSLHFRGRPSSISTRSKLLSSVVTKTPDCDTLDVSSLTSECNRTLQQAQPSRDNFMVTAAVARVVATLLAKATDVQRRHTRSSGIASLLVHLLWEYLSPSTPKFHVESVRWMWQLDSADADEGVLESSVSRFIRQDSAVLEDDSEPARRFAVLWTHSMNVPIGQQKRGHVARRASLTTLTTSNVESRDHQDILIRPLLLALEGLGEGRSELYFFLISWLKSASNLFTVFDVLICKLAVSAHQQRAHVKRDSNHNEHGHRIAHSDQTEEICYYLRHVTDLFKLPLDNIALVLSAQGTPIMEAGRESDETIQANTTNLCLDLVQLGFVGPAKRKSRSWPEMQCQALSIIQQVLSRTEKPGVGSRVLEESLLALLAQCTKLKGTASSVQVAVLDTIMSYLKMRYAQPLRQSAHQRKNSSVDSPTLRQSNADATNEKSTDGQRAPPPDQLLKSLQEGIRSRQSRNVLENWVAFLIDVLPLYAHALFQNLIPLVETFCKQIKTNFEQMQNAFAVGQGTTSVIPESSLMSLLNGLESTLAVAHDRLAAEENANVSVRPPEPTQGFFGNVVSGVFSSEAPKTRQSSANSRLTVILCLQDAVKICFSIWTWAAYGQEDERFDASSSASFSYSSSRLRNRARRLLDHMFISETLECLETLVASCSHGKQSNASHATSGRVISLLQSLDGSRPKRLMPAIFNSLYSRTNPTALEPQRMSSLTSDVKDIDVASFLVEYTRSLDDDAMDEIWMDCMTFLKDVLSNPFVHSSILSSLLLFLLSLAEKVEKTNFGEQRKMRRELSDLFQRLLQATLTSRSAGILHDPGDGTGAAQGPSVIDILTTILPKLSAVLPENSQQLAAITLISNNVFGSLTHAKQFPDNVTSSHFTLLQRVTRISAAAKVWRKDTNEVYNHPRLFCTDIALVSTGLVPVLRQWGITEKDRISETLHRIPSPSAAGIVFGVGANAARLEADKKSQLNLRRATLLVLALDTDALVPHMSTTIEKVTELLNASVTSSPSSATRAEIFMLIQAIVLKTQPVHLSSLWPIVTAELQRAMSSATVDTKNSETYNALSLLQACKLLDLLLLIGPDDFQMHAWLFITDTIDAVYRPTGPDTAPISLVDEIADELNQTLPATVATPMTPDTGHVAGLGPALSSDGRNKLLLIAKSANVKDMNREEVVARVLRPWFAQLSLQSFEREYSMRKVDWEGCRMSVLEELFEEGTMVA